MPVKIECLISLLPSVPAVPLPEGFCRLVKPGNPCKPAAQSYVRFRLAKKRRPRREPPVHEVLAQSRGEITDYAYLSFASWWAEYIPILAYEMILP
jgi:hypothetical protein